MTQLHCYVPEEIAKQAQRRAKKSGLSLSRYLAELVKRDATTSDWPPGYFDLFVSIEGAELTRAPQGEMEQRLELD
jgi:hypothetical protein